MSRKLNYISINPFFDRLYGLLKDDVKGWTKKLDVSAGTIVNRWFKGTYPGMENLQKLCEVSGKSADWFLFGTESSPMPNSSPHSLQKSPILQKAEYVLLHGDEREKTALEYGVEGVYNRVKDHKDIMKEMLDTQKEIVSLLKSDLGKMEMESKPRKKQQL